MFEGGLKRRSRRKRESRLVIHEHNDTSEVRGASRDGEGRWEAGCGAFMWPFVLFMCPCLSSARCIDGSVPVIDGTILQWCSRFNGA